jgi:hypothetical protein
MNPMGAPQITSSRAMAHLPEHFAKSEVEITHRLTNQFSQANFATLGSVGLTANHRISSPHDEAQTGGYSSIWRENTLSRRITAGSRGTRNRAIDRRLHLTELV